MRIDSQLSFVPIGGNLSLIGAAGVSIPSTNTLDLLGQGVGTPPANIIGNAAVFGMDVGIGGNKPLIQVNIGITATTSTSATLNVAFQAAADQGISGSYQPSAWNTLIETGPISVSALTSGAILARFDFPPSFPAGLNPRYLRLLFQVPTGTSFTAGTISSAVVALVRDDYSEKFASRNYTVV